MAFMESEWQLRVLITLCRIRVEADGGAFCGQGVTPTKQCPGIDFRRGLSIAARQDSPIETAPTQCYEDILLDDC